MSDRKGGTRRKSCAQAQSRPHDPNKVYEAYQVMYIGPASYAGTESEKDELVKTLRVFHSTQSKNPSIVKVQPSFLLGLFIVWTRTRESAESLLWSIEGYERKYEVVELHFD